MEELLLRVLTEGEWGSLRFSVYNWLDEKEYYQTNLGRLGYENSYDDLECKSFPIDNEMARAFKNFVEKTIQHENIVVAVCVIGDNNFMSVVKPKNVDANQMLKH